MMSFYRMLIFLFSRHQVWRTNTSAGWWLLTSMSFWLTNTSKQPSWESSSLSLKMLLASLWRWATWSRSPWGCSPTRLWSRRHTAGRCSTWPALSWAGFGETPQDFKTQKRQIKMWCRSKRQACPLPSSLGLSRAPERRRTWATRRCWSSSRTRDRMKTQRPKRACSTQLNNPSSCPPLKSKGFTGRGGAGANEAIESKQWEARRCSRKGARSPSVAEWTWRSILIKSAGPPGSSFPKNTTPSAVKVPAPVLWEKT